MNSSNNINNNYNKTNSTKSGFDLIVISLVLLNNFAEPTEMVMTWKYLDSVYSEVTTYSTTILTHDSASADQIYIKIVTEKRTYFVQVYHIVLLMPNSIKLLTLKATSGCKRWFKRYLFLHQLFFLP